MAQPTMAQCHRAGHNGPSTVWHPEHGYKPLLWHPTVLSAQPSTPTWGSPPPSPFSPNPLLPCPSPPHWDSLEAQG